MSPGTHMRRRPHCTKCGEPMAGHMRVYGQLVCHSNADRTANVNDQSSRGPPSPPVTPVPSPTRQSAAFNASRAKNPEKENDAPRPFAIPSTGPWHWRNPNYTSPDRPLRTLPPRSPSLVPTVLVDDDGNTVHGGDSDAGEDIEVEEGLGYAAGHWQAANGEPGFKIKVEPPSVPSSASSSASTESSMSKHRNAIVQGFDLSGTLYRVTPAEASRLQASATALGLQIGFMPMDRNPISGKSYEMAHEGNEKPVQPVAPKLLWAVIADDADVVQEFIASYQRSESMPGTYNSTASIVDHTRLVHPQSPPSQLSCSHCNRSSCAWLFLLWVDCMRMGIVGMVAGLTLLYGMSSF